ncbi:MAG: hypothetical protein M1150_04190 [Patescibacteria group bacterium]|nr:hypothetical protein [Patescibacteria group bacterium]
MTDFYSSVNQAVVSSLNQTAAFLPNLLAAIVIFVIGVIVSVIVKNILVKILQAISFEAFLAKTGVPQTLKKTDPNLTATKLLGEIIKWFVILVFLVPAVEALGLTEVTKLIDSLLLYLPNVVVAVIIIMVGAVFAQFTKDFVLAAATGLGSTVARALGQVARWSILVFAFLVALNQLGIAPRLIEILFTGFVAMLALAGGLAFGLGGKETAEDILKAVRDEIAGKK